jgi:hypothetical protein
LYGERNACQAMLNINFDSKNWNLVLIGIGLVIVAKAILAIREATAINDNWLLFRNILWLFIALVFVARNIISYSRKASGQFNQHNH